MLTSRDLVHWSWVTRPDDPAKAPRRNARARALGEGGLHLGARGDEGRRQVAALLHRQPPQARRPVPRSRRRGQSQRAVPRRLRRAPGLPVRPRRHDRRQSVPRRRRQALPLLQERREPGRQEDDDLGPAAGRRRPVASRARRPPSSRTTRNGNGSWSRRRRWCARRPGTSCSTPPPFSAGTRRSGCRATPPATRPAPGPLGPCKDAPENPILHSFNDQEAGCLSGPGHTSIFQVGGRHFIAFHAWSATKGCRKADDKRFLYVAPLFWKDGKPQIGMSLREAE